jgi:NtrC-family two-component system response regulator AlgB
VTAGTRVLIIDDERNIRSTLTMCLESTGCVVNAVGSAENALAAVERTPFDVCLLDLRLGDDDGMELLPKLLIARPHLAVIVITAHATFDTAVEAIKRGAADYLPKPFDPAQIRLVVDRVMRRRVAERRVAELETELAASSPANDISSESPAMVRTLELARRAASSEAPILIRGENGTGKSVLAHVIHANSSRATRTFMTINCPTLSEELLASELFGHRAGAFTGAVRDQEGRVEAADGGTLFLDEIGEISSGLQSKLLRFVQDKEFERVGETKTRRADVRVIAATNRDLDADVSAGRFRQDLLFRLNVIELSCPALRDRIEDVLPLARRFLAFFAQANKRAIPELTAEAEAVLVGYAWPGNVRELRNVIERAVILFSTQTIGVEALPDRVVAHTSAGPRLGADFTLEDIEREHVLRVLARTPSLDDAAKILDIDVSTLYRKRRKYQE